MCKTALYNDCNYFVTCTKRLATDDITSQWPHYVHISEITWSCTVCGTLWTANRDLLGVILQDHPPTHHKKEPLTHSHNHYIATQHVLGHEFVHAHRSAHKCDCRPSSAIKRVGTYITDSSRGSFEISHFLLECTSSNCMQLSVNVWPSSDSLTPKQLAAL